ncbi:MAG: hypothetical protein JWP25_8407, partial [Bradyrhizobium sp.]|nr:hypothetical protein [Bradyrhizobium sp.]
WLFGEKKNEVAASGDAKPAPAE